MKVKRTRTDVLSPIRSRWSPRAFSQATLCEADLEPLFEAALCAPSAFNERPWRFFYAYRGTPEFDTICNSLSPLNRTWATRAAVLVVTCVVETLQDGRKNPFALHDLGAANYSLLIQAASSEIYGHPIGGLYDPLSPKDTHYDSVGFDASYLHAHFPAMRDVRPAVILALGRLGTPDILPEPYKSQERAAPARIDVQSCVTPLTPTPCGDGAFLRF